MSSWVDSRSNSDGVESIKSVANSPERNVSDWRTLRRNGMFVLTPRTRNSPSARYIFWMTDMKFFSLHVSLTRRES